MVKQCETPGCAKTFDARTMRNGHPLKGNAKRRFCDECRWQRASEASQRYRDKVGTPSRAKYNAEDWVAKKAASAERKRKRDRERQAAIYAAKKSGETK